MNVEEVESLFVLVHMHLWEGQWRVDRLIHMEIQDHVQKELSVWPMLNLAFRKLLISWISTWGRQTADEAWSIVERAVRGRVGTPARS